MMNHRTSRPTFYREPRKRGAFTLVEVLVALAVMMVMMAIILIPINMGMSVFHIGKARSEVQQANQLVINQLTAELKQAVYVFPNERLAGITDKFPYSGNADQPYYNTVTPAPVSNTSRLDFLLPKIGSEGEILVPPIANNYVVTYYASRLDTTKNFDRFTNPVVMWRAQYAYREDGGNDFASYGLTNTNMSSSRYPIASPYDGQIWLTQNQLNEPNLLDISAFSADTALSSHTQITPRDMVLVASDAPTSLKPDSSFICADANGDGKIDRITISLLLSKYDSIGAAGDKSQQIRSTQTVALPNIR